MTPITEPDSTYATKKKTLRMIYHFVRVEASDIPVEADTEGQCLDRALAERVKQCRPSNVKGEIIE